MADRQGAPGATRRSFTRRALLRVVAPYALFAGLWILFSDKLLERLASDEATFARLSIYKGGAFVVVTSALLAVLTLAHLRERQRAFDRLEERVTERTRELAEANGFLDALVDHISSPVFFKDANLRFRGCNRAYEKAFDVRRDSFIGRTVLDLDYLPRADREVFQAEDAAMVAEGRTLSREAVIPFADGREHHTLYSVSGFRGPDGSPGGLVGILVDVTPLKEAEAALAAAKQAAESADRLKSAFLATMSHELRTPLNSIIGFTGILLKGLAGPLNDEQLRQLGMVQGSARHLLALINDVLDISKIEAGELKVGVASFDARALVERAVAALRPRAESKRLALRATIAPELGEIVSDARRIEQILLNLLGNAVKFTDRGEVALRAAVERGQLRVTVADTGIGIEPRHMAVLFQPFQQIDTGLARNHEGTGLGLAISRRLAHLLGGEIDAASEWGQGSTFTVTLPLRAPVAAAETPRPRGDAVGGEQGPAGEGSDP